MAEKLVPDVIGIRRTQQPIANMARHCVARFGFQPLDGHSVDEENDAGAVAVDLFEQRWKVHDVNLSGLKINKANLQGAEIAESRLDGMKINGILVTDLLATYQASRAAPPAA